MAKGGYMSGIFGSSPVSPLQQHMSKVYKCAQELVPLFNAVINEDWGEVSRLHKVISDLENEADDLKKELRLNLPKGLFMPVNRQDLLEVLLMQDKIANKSKDISGLILGRHMKLPECIHEDYIRFVERCVAAVKQARKAINEFDELVETGFSGREVEIVDLPGIYSFDAASLDEQVTRDYLLSREADLVLNVVDAANLERNLYFTVQLLEMGVPLVVALNMAMRREEIATLLALGFTGRRIRRLFAAEHALVGAITAAFRANEKVTLHFAPDRPEHPVSAYYYEAVERAQVLGLL